MNTTRNGKIARLPEAVREELNRRLRNGETGPKLCAWLHALPLVRAVLDAEFGGQPINAPNLTAWRQGGYRDWCEQADARALAQSLGKDESDMREHLLRGRQLATLRQWDAEGNAEKRWDLLREMSRDLIRLRELELVRQRRELDREWEELRTAPTAPSANPGMAPRVNIARAHQFKPFKYRAEGHRHHPQCSPLKNS